MLGDTTTLSINDGGTGGGSGAHTAVTGLKDITPPKPMVQRIKQTPLNENPGREVYVYGTRVELGEFSFTLFYSYIEWDRLNDHMEARTSRDYKITYPDTKTDTITGTITSVEKSKIENGVPVEITCTVSLDAAVVRA